MVEMSGARACSALAGAHIVMRSDGRMIEMAELGDNVNLEKKGKKRIADKSDLSLHLIKIDDKGSSNAVDFIPHKANRLMVHLNAID